MWALIKSNNWIKEKEWRINQNCPNAKRAFQRILDTNLYLQTYSVAWASKSSLDCKTFSWIQRCWFCLNPH